MLKEVIENINTVLISSGMFNKAYGLCEIIEKDTKKFPAEYCLNKYIQVSDFSNYSGIVYHRLDGDITISQEEDETEGCSDMSTKTYPCLLVACVKKDLFKNSKNDAYIDLSIIENIESLISNQSNAALASLLGADTVEISLTGASKDRYDIFKGEYSGIEMKMPFEYAYISINYEVSISQKISCYTPINCE